MTIKKLCMQANLKLRKGGKSIRAIGHRPTILNVLKKKETSGVTARYRTGQVGKTTAVDSEKKKKPTQQSTTSTEQR